MRSFARIMPSSLKIAPTLSGVNPILMLLRNLRSAFYPLLKCYSRPTTLMMKMISPMPTSLTFPMTPLISFFPSNPSASLVLCPHQGGPSARLFLTRALRKENAALLNRCLLLLPRKKSPKPFPPANPLKKRSLSPLFKNSALLSLSTVPGILPPRKPGLPGPRSLVPLPRKPLPRRKLLVSPLLTSLIGGNPKAALVPTPTCSLPDAPASLVLLFSNA